jgi:hypothetical protein
MSRNSQIGAVTSLRAYLYSMQNRYQLMRDPFFLYDRALTSLNPYRLLFTALSLFYLCDKREVPVLLIIIEAIADDKSVPYFKPHIICLHINISS